MLKASLSWEDMQVIDVENHYKSKNPKLNESKLSPLIVIDPIDKHRNAAAALSKEMIARFKDSAYHFLSKPSKEYFIIKYETPESIIKKLRSDDTALIIIKALGKEGKDDVVGSKLLKVHKHIIKNTKEFDITIHDWQWDKKTALMWYLFKNKKLPKEFLREGPPVKNKVNAKKFMEKYPNYFVKETLKGPRLYANVSRKFTTPKQLIEHLISSEYVKEKVKDIKIIYP